MNWEKICECGAEMTKQDLFKHWTNKGKLHECQMAVRCPKCKKEEIIKQGVKFEIWREVN